MIQLPEDVSVPLPKNVRLKRLSRWAPQTPWPPGKLKRRAESRTGRERSLPAPTVPKHMGMEGRQCSIVQYSMVQYGTERDNLKQLHDSILHTTLYSNTLVHYNTIPYDSIASNAEQKYNGIRYKGGKNEIKYMDMGVCFFRASGL